jgi:hypothetical protein
MSAQRQCFMLLATLGAATAGTHVLAQTTAPAVRPANALQSVAIPDFSGVWRHPSLPGFEPLASGPTAVTNKSRTRSGASNWNQLVGDYTNPILQPWAAEIVKKHGEISLTGVTYPTPANQCWPEPPPYIFWRFIMEMVQTPDLVTFLYSDPGHQFRQVRMNKLHPEHVTPSWYGDSVGHYEGETLVIDTVGIRADRPYAMVDAYGTPYTAALHVVERYRLLDYADAKTGLDQDKKENSRVQVDSVNYNYRGKHLQLQFTVEDEGAFTTPWSATITYLPSLVEWEEEICTENIREYYNNADSDVPRADKPDF